MIDQNIYSMNTDSQVVFLLFMHVCIYTYSKVSGRELKCVFKTGNESSFVRYDFACSL